MWDNGVEQAARDPDAEKGRLVIDVLQGSEAALVALGRLADAARSKGGLRYVMPLGLVAAAVTALADTWHLGDLDTFDPDRCRVVAVDIGRGILVVEASGDDWARRTRAF